MFESKRGMRRIAAARPAACSQRIYVGPSRRRKACEGGLREALHENTESRSPQANTLMIYIEPTPYILALVRRIVSCADLPVDVLFIGADISQPWVVIGQHSGGLPPPGTIAAGVCREALFLGQVQRD